MATYYEVPLSGAPQAFNIALPVEGSSPLVTNQYRVVFQYRGAAGWVMDIYDASGNPIRCGAPLVTGCDLLEQFAYLGMGGGMGVYSDGVPDAVPTFDNLGSGSHLMWVTVP